MTHAALRAIQRSALGLYERAHMYRSIQAEFLAAKCRMHQPAACQGVEFHAFTAPREDTVQA